MSQGANQHFALSSNLTTTKPLLHRLPASLLTIVVFATVLWACCGCHLNGWVIAKSMFHSDGIPCIEVSLIDKDGRNGIVFSAPSTSPVGGWTNRSISSTRAKGPAKGREGGSGSGSAAGWWRSRFFSSSGISGSPTASSLSRIRGKGSPGPSARSCANFSSRAAVCSWSSLSKHLWPHE